VAWSNLITNECRARIFDFFTATENFPTVFSTSKVEGPKHSFHWQLVIPLAALGGTVAARQGVLGDSGRTERA